MFTVSGWAADKWLRLQIINLPRFPNVLIKEPCPMSLSSPKLRAVRLAGRVRCDCRGSGQSSLLQPEEFCQFFSLPDPFLFLQKTSSQSYMVLGNLHQQHTPFCLLYISPGCKDKSESEGLLEKPSEFQDKDNKGSGYLRVTLIGSVIWGKLMCLSLPCLPIFEMRLFALEGTSSSWDICFIGKGGGKLL